VNYVNLYRPPLTPKYKSPASEPPLFEASPVIQHESREETGPEEHDGLPLEDRVERIEAQQMYDASIASFTVDENGYFVPRPPPEEEFHDVEDFFFGP